MSVPPRVDLQAITDKMKALGATGLRLPPPVLEDMQADVRDYRPVEGDGIGSALIVRFPVLERYQNPMGTMQGGVMAAAVDNVIGPLSYLVAPPSVTAQLTMTYLAPATRDMEWVEVEARLAARAGRQLVFNATVRAPAGHELALARSTNTIVRRLRST